MKLQVAPEWSLLGGLMKANFNKKYDIEDQEKNNPHTDETGDFFYDYIGKFCNNDSSSQFHQNP